jgi:hypothetical protein
VSACIVCHHENDKNFTIKINNKIYTFDCFECAIYKLAPCCARCHCTIIGHGITANRLLYCGEDCVRAVIE